MIDLFLVWMFMIAFFGGVYIWGLVIGFLDSIGCERAAAVTVFLGLTFIAAVCMWGIS